MTQTSSRPIAVLNDWWQCQQWSSFPFSTLYFNIHGLSSQSNSGLSNEQNRSGFDDPVCWYMKDKFCRNHKLSSAKTCLRNLSTSCIGTRIQTGRLPWKWTGLATMNMTNTSSFQQHRMLQVKTLCSCISRCCQASLVFFLLNSLLSFF